MEMLCVKNIVVEIQSTIDEVKRRTGATARWTNILKNLIEALSHKEARNYNGVENIKEKFGNMEAIRRRINIWLLGVQERKRNKNREQLLFEGIVEIKFPDVKMNIFSLKKTWSDKHEK